MTLIQEWSAEKKTLESKGQKIVYPEQKKTGKWIVRLFKKNNLVTLCAPPQWGKTGVSLYVSFTMCKNNIDPQKVFFLTGMSDLSWIEQTKERVLPSWKKNVYHRNTLHKFEEEIEHLKDRDKDKDILLIIDECHIANKSDNTLSEMMNYLDLNKEDYLIEKNIKILQISATPSNSLIDAKTWTKHAHFSPRVGSEYVSFKRMIEDNRVFDKKKLEIKDNCKEYIKDVSKGSPLFHIIRCTCSGPNGKDIYKKTKFNFSRFCKNKFKVVELNMSKSQKEIKEIYSSLSERPDVHTFILIKNMLGASKTLDDKYIGSVYESAPSKKDYSSEIQGLAGRMCGWSKKIGTNGVKIYCDRYILERYVELYESNFDYEKEDFEWRDGRLKISLLTGKINSSESYLSIVDIEYTESEEENKQTDTSFPYSEI